MLLRSRYKATRFLFTQNLAVVIPRTLDQPTRLSAGGNRDVTLNFRGDTSCPVPFVAAASGTKIARFHSDAEATRRSGAPRWYRRLFKRKFDTLNDRQLRRWLDDPGYDPVFEPRHLHSANWSW